jgi:hypothetical protein
MNLKPVDVSLLESFAIHMYFHIMHSNDRVINNSSFSGVQVAKKTCRGWKKV